MTMSLIHGVLRPTIARIWLAVAGFTFIFTGSAAAGTDTSSTGSATFATFSSPAINDDDDDNVFLEQFPRYASIDEDTQARYLLVGEYAAILGSSRN